MSSPPSAHTHDGRIRVGVIGAGSISQQMHLPYLTELEDRFELIGVCDASTTLAHSMAERHGAQFATTDHRELLRRDIDAVVIAVNVPSEDLTIEALAAGCHVLVEKPLAYSPRQAERVREAALKSPGELMVAYMKRYDPIFAVAEELVAGMADELRGGIVRCVAGPNELYIRDVATISRATDLPDNAAATRDALIDERIRDAIGDFDAATRLAYQLILGITCHELSVLRGLLGAPLEVSSAEIWDGGRWLRATLGYGGFAVTYLLGRLATRVFDELVEIYSEHETVTLSFPSPFLKNAPTQLVHRREDNGRTIEATYIASYEEAFRQELIQFHESVRGRKPVITGADDACGDAEIMAAIVRAARERRAQALTGQI